MAEEVEDGYDPDDRRLNLENMRELVNRAS
jgi:hypothetical protein